MLSHVFGGYPFGINPINEYSFHQFGLDLLLWMGSFVFTYNWKSDYYNKTVNGIMGLLTHIYSTADSEYFASVFFAVMTEDFPNTGTQHDLW